MLILKKEGTGKLIYATSHSAGFDISAEESLVIKPGERALISTGLRIVESVEASPLQMGDTEIKVLPEIQLRPRSGLAYKKGITVLNAPSTIDADYRGEIKVLLINLGTEDFPVEVGDRIAQGVCALVFQAPNIEVKETVRGEGGFGSTGVQQK